MVSQAEFQAAGFPVGGRLGHRDQGVGQVDATRFAADREPGGLELCL